jgi:histidine triad (HIT) family protein
VFCSILEGTIPASFVFVDDDPHGCAGFLDVRPLFKGHTLVVPKAHHETLADLPEDLLEPLFGHARRLSQAMEEVLGAAGSFVALNNKVSQSVPHLHVHVVPRHRKDGLKGFFWPRTKYDDDSDRDAWAARLRDGLAGPST